MALASDKQAVAWESQVLKLGGPPVATGGLGYLAVTLGHGDMADETTQIAMQHIVEFA